jgi:hypothetical protein
MTKRNLRIGKAGKIVYWISTIWLATGMLVTGILQFSKAQAGEPWRRPAYTALAIWAIPSIF